jgi:hypothetical protein
MYQKFYFIRRWVENEAWIGKDIHRNVCPTFEKKRIVEMSYRR